MKKVLLLIPLLIIFTTKLDAACNYSDIKERNALASFVDYNYDYNETNKTFNLTIYNLKNNLKVNYENKKLDVNNSESKITEVKPGSLVKIKIVSDDDCYRQTFRIININIPYVNKYYGNPLCAGHEELKVCSSKYLDYELSESTFNSLINKEKEEEIEQEKVIVYKEKTLLEKIVDFLKIIYIPFILVILSSLITTIIFSTILRKIKHGI